jgi:hypothetical protein
MAKSNSGYWRELRTLDITQRAGKPVLRSQARSRAGNYFWQML